MHTREEYHKRINFTHWCIMKPNECHNASSITKVSYSWHTYVILQNIADRKEASLQLDKVLVKCSYEGSNNCHSIHKTYTTRYGNCFTINSNWTSTAVDRNSSKISRLRRVNGIYMHFYLHLDPNISFDRTSDVFIALSSPDSIPDLVNDVYRLSNGTAYTFSISQTTSHLLPPPYVTNCTDYDKMGRTSFRSGLLTRQTCFSECVANLTLEMCGCIYITYHYLYELPGSVRACEMEMEKGVCKSNPPKSETVDVQHYCSGICRAPCRKVTYEVSRFKQPLFVSGTADEKSTQQIYQNFLKKPVSLEFIKSAGIRVNLMFKNRDLMVYQHYPSYQNVELFSYIGGYIGIWLGISLANVLDVIINCSIKIKNWYLDLKEQSSKIIESFQQDLATTDVIEE